MKSLSCLIIDNEPLAIEGIKIYVKEYTFLNLLKTFNKPIEAQNFLKQNKVDLIFLDIEMPNLNGFELIQGLKNPPLIIFTTAYHQYALESFELNVIDYLLKPIGPERFKRSIDKVKSFFNYNSLDFNITNSDYFFVRADRKSIKVYFCDIKYIKGLKDYVIIYTKESKFITAINIKNILTQLPSYFIRIGKSYIINIEYIDIVNSNYIIIDGEQLPIGRVYKKNFIKHLNKSSYSGKTQF